ncbi:hypothetical protein INT45_008523 [Circinella minor]|uniref:C2H2-type domain-containing protein n=1 Tax=Circinella minor TaxID=1195481 RepID=A0A8H7SBJ5_9FUNG|nr:hypothetical protein INT45_008523 [Circinella minor]
MTRHEQRWQQLLVTRAGQHLQEGQQSIDLPEQNPHQHLQQLENYDNLGYADTIPHHSCNRQNSIHDRNTLLFSSQSQSSSSSRGPYMELLSCPFEEDTILQNFLGEASQQQEDSMVTAPSPTMHIFYSNTNNSMVDQAISESLGNSSYYDPSSAMNHQQLLFPSHQQMITQSYHQGSQSPMEIQHDNYLDENLLFSMSSKSHHQHNNFIHASTSPCSLSPVMAPEPKSTSISINNVSNNNSPMVTEDSEQEQSPDSSPNINETENLPSDTDDEESGDYYERNNGAGPRFYCSRCPGAGQKGYRRLRELLSRHIRPFHYDVRFRCNTCGKKYTRSDSLTLHKNRKQH